MVMPEGWQRKGNAMQGSTTIGNDEVLLENAETALVSSASQPGTFHHVAFDICDCKGFEYRGRCRHIDAVQAARAIAAVRVTCPSCGRKTSPLQVQKYRKCALCMFGEE